MASRRGPSNRSRDDIKQLKYDKGIAEHDLNQANGWLEEQHRKADERLHRKVPHAFAVLGRDGDDAGMHRGRMEFATKLTVELYSKLWVHASYTGTYRHRERAILFMREGDVRWDAGCEDIARRQAPEL